MEGHTKFQHSIEQTPTFDTSDTEKYEGLANIDEERLNKLQEVVTGKGRLNKQDKEDIAQLLDEIKEARWNEEAQNKEIKNRQEFDEILESKVQKARASIESKKISKRLKSLDPKTFFNRMEDKWSKQGEDPKYVQEQELADKIDKLKPEDREEIIKAQETKLEDDTMELLDRLHKESPEIYPSAEEYKKSIEKLTILDNERKDLEIEITEQFKYDVVKNSMWQRFNVGRKFAPDERKQFKAKVNAYKTITQTYNNLDKEHIKKFSEVMDLISPRAKLNFRYTGKHPELGPPRIW